MKMFWANLSKQKFMHFAATIILLTYTIIIIYNMVFISTHTNMMGKDVIERLISDNNQNIREMVSMVLLYFFSRSSIINDHLDHDKV